MLADLRHVFCRAASWKVDNKLMLLKNSYLHPRSLTARP